MSDRDHNGGFFSGLVLGALIGAGLFYFLTSTEEGKKVKKQWQEKGENALDNLADLIKEVEDKGKEFEKKAKEIQAELEDKLKDVKEEVAEEAKEQLGHIDKLRERGRQATKRFFTRGGKALA
jgi:gas vesicle protein